LTSRKVEAGRAFERSDVAEVFAAIPDEPRAKLLRVRELIFETAAKISEVGPLQETLKWGEPSYLPKSKSGTTVRIHWKEKNPQYCALYVHCQTDLVARFRERFDKDLEFEGSRAVFFRVPGRLPVAALRGCIEMALTYHLSP